MLLDTCQPFIVALKKAAKQPQALTRISRHRPKLTDLKKECLKIRRKNSDQRQDLEKWSRKKGLAAEKSVHFIVYISLSISPLHLRRLVAQVDKASLNSRVAELFYEYDTDHDGCLTREEFVKGLIDSGTFVHV